MQSKSISRHTAPYDAADGVRVAALLSKRNRMGCCNNLKSRTAVGVTTNYNHDAANQLTEVLKGAARIKGMVYDAVGNITQKCDGKTFSTWTKRQKARPRMMPKPVEKSVL